VVADRYDVRSNRGESEFRALFQLDVSLRDVLGNALSCSPELHDCLASQPGLRVLAQSDPEEVFFSFLCTPNNNVERITRMVRTLESFGEPFADRPDFRRFPQAERIAAIGEGALRKAGFGYRGKTIPIAAKELIERGAGWLNGLKRAGYREAHAELLEISGVGPKLADCICLFGLGFSEAVPVDTHLWQAACREYFPEWSNVGLTEKRYREIGELFRSKFGRYAGWVHQYMFLDNFTRWRSGRGRV
jgi:N-glycosylase/DNA lyase